MIRTGRLGASMHFRQPKRASQSYEARSIPPSFRNFLTPGGQSIPSFTRTLPSVQRPFTSTDLLTLSLTSHSHHLKRTAANPLLTTPKSRRHGPISRLASLLHIITINTRGALLHQCAPSGLRSSFKVDVFKIKRVNMTGKVPMRLLVGCE